MQVKKREDLIGQTGSITRNFTIIDAKEGKFGIDIRVRDDRGEEYWTSLEDVSLDG